MDQQINDIFRAVAQESGRLDFATRGVQVLTHDDGFSVRLAADVVFYDRTVYGAMAAMLAALGACATREDAVRASAERMLEQHAARRAAKKKGY